MVVSEGAINNIMGGMENTAGVRLHSHRHKLKQRFEIIRKLGQGTYGKVQLAVNKETGQEVAIKTIKKAKIETEQDLIRIRREIQIMSSVQHPQIIHIYEVFENREKMVLVMEYAAGGELYDYLSERKVLSEDEARRVFRHVASATYYCHKHKICHRDLKLENILLDVDGNAKIADFGLSNVFDDKHRLDTFCGSPLYASPEIVKGIPYTGPEVDCWSLGVLLYTLVYGAMPFDGSNFKRLVKQITQGDYYEPKKPSRASELIRQMLTVSASKRATVEDICGHWWVDEGQLEPCLDVAEALANQTPVRLDLLLSLAPKHINSEHMLIQPEDDDSSARSPPNSEASRPPPQLQLPPPPLTPPAEGPARSASLGAVSSGACNDIEALVAQRRMVKKEEEKKRKADETGAVDKKKKRESGVEGTTSRSGSRRKGEEAGTSSRRPPVGPEEVERKKSVKKRETALADGEATEERRKSGAKKREPLLTDGEASDLSERSERRRSVRSEAEKSEKRKSSVKKRSESTLDKETAASENERTEKKKTVKKRETSLTREYSGSDKPERRKSTRKKDESRDSVVAGKDDSEHSVMNGERVSVEEEQGEGVVKGEGMIKVRASKVEEAKEDQARPQAKAEVVDRGAGVKGECKTEPMEVDESVSREPERSKSMESNEGTLKASDSSISRESVSPGKQAGPREDTPQGKTTPSPPPGHTAKVLDARKAFEAKPIEKPGVYTCKKSVTESLPSSPSKETPSALPTTQSGPIPPKDTPSKEKSPVKDPVTPTKEKPGKEIEKPREKSPKKVSEVASKAPIKSKSAKLLETENYIQDTKPTSSKVPIVEKKTKAEETTKKMEETGKRPEKAEVVMKKLEKAEEIEKKGRKGERGPGNSEEAVLVGGLNLKLGEVGKISEVGTTTQEVVGHAESDSSDSESEAEKLLKIVSEKREKVEAARQEQLRRVSVAREGKKDMPAIREEKSAKSPSQTKSPPQSKSPSQSRSPPQSAPTAEVKEPAPEHKFATLPRGFKSKTPHRPIQPQPTPTAASTTPLSPHHHPSRKVEQNDKAINQEIEGMMSAIKAVDRAITKDRSEGQEKDRKKSQLEIVLNNKPEPSSKRASYAEIKLSSPSSREPPRTPEYHRAEVRHSVGGVQPGPGPGEAQLQRAKRERIIPIMLEDDDDDDDTTTSDTLPPQDRCGGVASPPLGPRVVAQPPYHLNSRPSDPRSPLYNPSPEPIRKSRRERIIPIAVEGEGLVTPSVGAHVDEAAELGAAQAHQAFSRNMAPRPSPLNGMAEGEGGVERVMSPPPRRHPADTPAMLPTWSRRLTHTNSRGGGFMVEHSDSFSSAGEEEEDEDDGFQILTAESLFSTLLNRVRSLTRKMNQDEGRGGGVDRGRRSSRPTPEPCTAPASHSASAAGFWSSLYNSPRDSPARRISENMSRGSLVAGREDDAFASIWPRPASVSRDTSDADTLFSDASATSSAANQFGTLPRGWRASRWSGGEDGGESDTSDASVRSLGRRHQYSRAPSRELHNIPDEELTGQRGMYSGAGGMSLPRPYPIGSGGGLNRGPQQQDSADRIAAMYGTLRGPLRRPHSSVVGQPGECIGRDGGLCEQHTQHIAAASQHDANANQQASSLSPGTQHQAEDTEALKQSVQEQLQQLVRELEAGDDSLPQLTTPLPANKPQYSSNPVLNISCTSPQPRETQGSSVPMIRGETAANNNRKNWVFHSTLPSSDSLTHRSLLDISKDGTSSDSIRRPYSSTDWLRPGSNVVRSADSSALDAYRRYHGRGLDLHRYQRGKSEDLRQALDSLSQMDSQKTMSVTSLTGNDTQDFPDSNLLVSDIRQLGSSAQNLTGMVDNTRSSTYENVNANGEIEPLSNSNLNLLNNNTATRTMSPTNDPNNNSGITNSRSSTGIPVKNSTNTSSSSTCSAKGVHSSQSGNSISTNTAITSNKPDLLHPKVYCKSKSRELTPTIEAASEKFGQLNSGTLKRISPFEVYRRTKSRELPLEQTNTITTNNRDCTIVRLKSPPPPAVTQGGHECAKSPFEKAKTTIEKKFDRVKSPDNAGLREVLPGSVHSPSQGAIRSASTAGEQNKNERIGNSVAKDKVEKSKENATKVAAVKQEKEKDVVKVQEKESEKNQEKSSGAGRKEDDSEKEKPKVKKTASCDPEKPKSMYKLLASRFNRSGSNVSESNRATEKKQQDEDEGVEKDDKFRLKRPSRFLKHRAEKSASKSSLCDPDSGLDDSERADRKPSKKLTNALNKFLGRKESKEDHKGSSTSLSKSAALVKAPMDDDLPKKPPRFKAKKFSKSQENLALSRIDDMAGETCVCDNGPITSAKSDTTTTTTTTTTITTTATHMPNYTLESVTKSICNHLSQLESDISSRIGNMGSPTAGGECRTVPAVTSTVCSITTYGLSPALASRRNGRPTNLDIAAASINSTDSKAAKITSPPFITASGNTATKTAVTTATKTAATKTITSTNTPKLAPIINSTSSSAGMKSPPVVPNNTSSSAGMKSPPVIPNNTSSSAGMKSPPAIPNTPTVSPSSVGGEGEIRFAQIKQLGSGGEAKEGSGYSTEGEDTRGVSEGEDESVMDRITRKSYYSKFQNKKKPKLRRANTKEDMEQQLAAAKARLMKEDTERALRESFSPNRFPSSPVTSPRTSLISPPTWEPTRRPSRKSLPPDDSMVASMFSMGGRRGSSLQPDHLLPSLGHDGTVMGTHRLPSLPPEDQYHARAPSLPLDHYQRVRSPPKDHLHYRRSTSLVREELSPPISATGSPGAGSSGTSKQDEGQVQDAMAVAAAAGALAGEVAATVAAADSTGSRSREPSVNRLRSPEPSRQDDTRAQAREELSRRLTHLTRISGTSGLARVGPATLRAVESEQRPYRRTQTTGRLAGEVGPSSGVPVYRRTNTMDLPPADARARPGSEYRRHLNQDPTRRSSARWVPSLPR